MMRLHAGVKIFPLQVADFEILLLLIHHPRPAGFLQRLGRDVRAQVEDFQAEERAFRILHRFDDVVAKRWARPAHSRNSDRYREAVSLPAPALFAQLRRDLGPVFRSLAEQKECTVEEGHLMPDHVHMLVSQVMGFVKGKSAIHIARVYAGRRRNFVGQHFWARGYWVSTVGKNEAAARRYIQEQEKEDQRLEQMELTAL